MTDELSRKLLRLLIYCLIRSAFLILYKSSCVARRLALSTEANANRAMTRRKTETNRQLFGRNLAD